jgi:hypothetical protein
MTDFRAVAAQQANTTSTRRRRGLSILHEPAYTSPRSIKSPHGI